MRLEKRQIGNIELRLEIKFLDSKHIVSFTLGHDPTLYRETRFHYSECPSRAEIIWPKNSNFISRQTKNSLAKKPLKLNIVESLPTRYISPFLWIGLKFNLAII